MHAIHRSIISAVLISAVPFASRGESLRCEGDIISQGDTEQKLLETCGQPASREGNDWLYKSPGSLPVVVTVGRGLVMFIRTQDVAETFIEHPMGDPP
jgi:hypothetical protein